MVLLGCCLGCVTGNPYDRPYQQSYQIRARIQHAASGYAQAQTRSGSYQQMSAGYQSWQGGRPTGANYPQGQGANYPSHYPTNSRPGQGGPIATGGNYPSHYPTNSRPRWQGNLGVSNPTGPNGPIRYEGTLRYNPRGHQHTYVQGSGWVDTNGNYQGRVEFAHDRKRSAHLVSFF